MNKQQYSAIKSAIKQSLQAQYLLNRITPDLPWFFPEAQKVSREEYKKAA